MNWTRERPTAAGYYWMRWRSEGWGGWGDWHTEPVALVLEQRRDQYVLELLHVGSEVERDLDEYEGALWAGPLTPPEENES